MEKIILHALKNDTIALELQVEGEPVSSLRLIFQAMRFGSAVVRCAALAGVATREQHRNRGYSSRLIEHAKGVMRREGAALSVVDGIRNYYHQFGYAFVQPTSFISVFHEPGEKASLPQGWQFRTFMKDDLPVLANLYDDNTRVCSGAVVRMPSGSAWTRLVASSQESQNQSCRVLLNAQGEMVGYAWRGLEFWKPRAIQSESSDFFLIAEAFAATTDAADALLNACLAWAREEQTAPANDLHHLVYYVPSQSRVAHAAKFRTSRFWKNFHPNGGFRALILDTPRLFASLQPELDRRARSAHWAPTRRLVFQTDAGTSRLECSEQGATLCEPDNVRAEDIVLPLAQQTLAQMLFGSFSVGALLTQPHAAMKPEALALLDILFPQHDAYTFPIDRF